MARVPSQQKKQKAMKLVARRLAIRWLRKLLDYADERLHAAEVRLRNDLAVGQRSDSGNNPRGTIGRLPIPTRPNSFSQWEARNSGVAPVSKKSRRRGMSAAEFDLRLAR